MKKNKFYEFKNEAEESCELYIYGALTDDKESDWFASEQDVDLTDFKNALEKLTQNCTLNIYVNSPGGSVFASSTMASMLQRAKETKGIKIISYIDGLCASASSFLIMVSDEIKLYTNSMLMIHKPMSLAIGNANDMQREIDTLNSIENNVMIPLYMKKAKCDEDTIRNLIDAESWLSAKETDKYFDVVLLDSAKECTACVDTELFKRYKNVPEELKEEKPAKEQEVESKPQEVENEPQEEEKGENKPNIPDEQENTSNEPETKLEEVKKNDEEEPKQHNVVENTQNIDYSYFEDKLSKLKGEK